MIEINLIPEELRKKQPVKFILPSVTPRTFFLLALSIFILPHIFIQLLIVANGAMLKHTEKAFAAMSLERQQVDSLSQQLERAKAFAAAVSHVNKQRFVAAPKLNSISNVLAQGVWLSEISFSPEGCEIKGSCYSATSQELAQIGSFLNALKSDAYMSKSFARLNLVSVQRRKLGATEVVDFTITSKSQSK